MHHACAYRLKPFSSLFFYEEGAIIENVRISWLSKKKNKIWYTISWLEKRKTNNPWSLLSLDEIYETLKSNKNIFHFLGHMKTAYFKSLFANLKKVG